ncbi:hypothetical protein EDD11_000203 [Mortierella claussenii]|nr:hypothetical protein EDD11_000203 [Mortierella claussenii]
MERNVVLQRFVKSISPLAPSVLLQEFGQDDFLEEDNDQDIDFHVGRALDIPTTNHPRQLRKRREVAYYVDEIPSSPLEESYASDTEVEGEETKEADFSPTTPDVEERAESIRIALKNLDPEFFAPDVYESLRSQLELAHDCTLGLERNLEKEYIKKRCAELIALAEEERKLNTYFPPPNPFL